MPQTIAAPRLLTARHGETTAGELHRYIAQRMYRRITLLILSFLVCFTACRENSQETTTSATGDTLPRAIALNNSAMMLASSSVYRDTNDLKRAVTLLDSSIAIDSSYRTAYNNKVSLLSTQGKKKEAAATLEEWMRRYPSDQDVRFFYAWVLKDKNKMREVAPVLLNRQDSLIRSHPDSVVLKAYRPFWMYVAGHKQEAVSEIDSLAARYPNSMDIDIQRQALTDSTAMSEFDPTKW